MKRITIISMILTIILGGQAVHAHRGYGLTSSEILEAVPEGAAKRPEELTVAEWTALAGAASVARQEDRYVGGAQFLSFVLPGVGQFATGDVVGGFLHLGLEAAIIAGTAAAHWYLLPDDLQDGSLSRSERRSIREDYWDSGDGAELLPSMGVAAAGLTLSIVHRVIAAKDAGATARDNIESGKVVFEPQIYVYGSRFGFGMRMRIH